MLKEKLIEYWLEKEWGYFTDPDDKTLYEKHYLEENYEDFLLDMETTEWVGFTKTLL